METIKYWKFNEDSDFPEEKAQQIADRIQSGEYNPPNDYGSKYYKFMGYCFDVGRKAYLIEYEHGSFERKYAKSIGELRDCCYLSKNDKVILDPFK